MFDNKHMAIRTRIAQKRRSKMRWRSVVSSSPPKSFNNFHNRLNYITLPIGVEDIKNMTFNWGFIRPWRPELLS